MHSPSLFARNASYALLTVCVLTVGLFLSQPQVHGQPAASACPPGVPAYDSERPSGGVVCVPPGNAAFAQSVVSFTPGTYTLNVDCRNTGQFYPPRTQPANQGGTASGALGPPDVPYSQNQTPAVRLNNDASLGGGGVLVVRFGVPLTGDGNTATPDIWVWEVGQIAEGYRVDVSPDGAAWTTIGNSDLSSHGSQGWDIDRSGFGPTARLFYARITDTSRFDDACQGGADIDAIAALSSITPAISLVKTANPTSGVQAGDLVTYTFLVSNPGTDTLLNLVVTDPLPGMGPIVCQGTTLAPAASLSCTSTYTVTAADVTRGIIDNTATVTGVPQATPGTTVTASDSAIVTPITPPPPQPVDLTIAKSHTDTFVQGRSASYNITVTNVSQGTTADTVRVVDTTPPGFTATAMGGDGWICSVQTLTCVRGDPLMPGASYPPIRLTVSVAASVAPGTYINIAVVTGGNDSNPANNTAQDPTPLVAPPSVIDLTISKSHTAQFVAGGTGTYIVTISNLASVPSSGIVTTVDTLPPGITATSMAGDGWSCNVGALTCTRADVLAPGGVYPTIAINVDIAANVPSGPAVNTATVSGGGDQNPANNTATDTVSFVTPVPTLPTTMLVVLMVALSATALRSLRRRGLSGPRA